MGLLAKHLILRTTMNPIVVVSRVVSGDSCKDHGKVLVDSTSVPFDANIAKLIRDRI